jgi:ABC-2 type transport system permease protein
MMRVLVGKLLRDVRLMLAVVALLLGAFQCLWAKITERIIGQIAPLVSTLAGYGGIGIRDIENQLFQGPAKALRMLIGGEGVDLQNAQDMLTIGYVHPLLQTLICIWAIGRAAGAIAGEIDRGTMELLLSQPLARSRLILAHLIVDLVTIPLLCLSLWAGTALGAWIISPIQIQAPPLPPKKQAYIVELGPFKVRVEDPVNGRAGPPQAVSDRLTVQAAPFGRALWLVGGLMFAVCGATMWLSSAGRSRWRVLGVAVFIALIQFLINLVGQMWDVLGPLRPLTVFYYYQPQQVILGQDWTVSFREWNGGHPLVHVPMPLVLFAVGIIGYLLALRTFHRRDIPAPL